MRLPAFMIQASDTVGLKAKEFYDSIAEILQWFAGILQWPEAGLENMRKELDAGVFPFRDKAKFDGWLAERAAALQPAQRAWYEQFPRGDGKAPTFTAAAGAAALLEDKRGEIEA
jgi:hypothetical protein